MGQNQRGKIVMSDEQIAEFIEHSRTATMATVLPSGRPHLVAMWYAVLDGEIDHFIEAGIRWKRNAEKASA